MSCNAQARRSGAATPSHRREGQAATIPASARRRATICARAQAAAAQAPPHQSDKAETAACRRRGSSRAFRLAYRASGNRARGALTLPRPTRDRARRAFQWRWQLPKPATGPTLPQARRCRPRCPRRSPAGVRQGRRTFQRSAGSEAPAALPLTSTTDRERRRRNFHRSQAGRREAAAQAAGPGHGAAHRGCWGYRPRQDPPPQALRSRKSQPGPNPQPKALRHIRCRSAQGFLPGLEKSGEETKDRAAVQSPPVRHWLPVWVRLCRRLAAPPDEAIRCRIVTAARASTRVATRLRDTAGD